MSYEVVYTNNFERELKHLAKKYPSIKSDLEGLISSLRLPSSRSRRPEREAGWPGAGKRVREGPLL
jgi:mRNA-degrading endonuclease RelE of RelBE toxin-antitoxin system